MKFKWNTNIVSDQKILFYCSLATLAVTAVAYSYTVYVQYHQKEVDTLLEFKQIYIEQKRSIGKIDCLEANFPQLVPNSAAIPELKRSLGTAFTTVTEGNGTDLGFDAQKAVIIGSLKVTPNTDEFFSKAIQRAAPDQRKAMAEICGIKRD